MKQIAAITLAAAVSLSGANAQETQPKSDMGEGLSLLEEGARLFLKGLADEMEPALEELSQQLQPAVAELLRLIEDFDAYHLPEKLPNGDIIIRRKTADDAADGEIEI